MSPQRSLLYLFLGTLLVLLAFAPARTWFGDGEEACFAAESWLRTGMPVVASASDVSSNITSNIKAQTRPSMRPLLFTASCVPSVVLAGKPTSGESPPQKLARGLIPALWGAGTVVALVSLFAGAGVAPWMSRAFAIATMFSTPLWNYSRIHYSDGIQVLCVILLMVSVAKKRGFMAGLLVGALLNLRTTNALLAIPVVWAFWIAPEPGSGGQVNLVKRRSMAMPSFVAGMIPWCVAWAWFNHLRFGAWNITGYEDYLVFSGPLTGAWGNLLSPGKSIFLYAPLAIAGVIAWCRRVEVMSAAAFMRTWDAPLVAGVAIILGVASTWWCWSGDWAWGPRMVIPAVPALVLPAVMRCSAAGPSRRFRVLTLVACVAGFILQIPVTIIGSHYLTSWGSFVDQQAFGATPTGGISIADDLIFAHHVPDFSPLLTQFQLLGAMGLHGRDYVVDFTAMAGRFNVPGFKAATGTVAGQSPDFWFWNTGASMDSHSYAVAAVLMLLAGVLMIRRAFASPAGIP